MSVVIPAYNAGQWIEPTLRSVLAQTYAADEIVVVNDASTDDTAGACRRVARRRTRVPIVYHEHDGRQGGGATRNTGVRIASGDWILNVDADDIVPRSLLGSLIATAAAVGEDAVVHTEFAQFFRDERTRRLGIPVTRRRLLHRWRFESGSRTSFLTRRESPANAGNRLFSRATFEAVGGYLVDTGPYDAWTFGLSCYAIGRPFVFAPRTSYLHRLHSQSYWRSSEREGENRRYLYNALAHFPAFYPEPVLRLLTPDSPAYPDDPFAALEQALAAA